MLRRSRRSSAHTPRTKTRFERWRGGRTRRGVRRPAAAHNPFVGDDRSIGPYFLETVTDALALFVGSAFDVALTVTTDGDGTDDGAR